MTIAMLLVVYLALVGLATVRARQSSTKVFYLLAGGAPLRRGGPLKRGFRLSGVVRLG